MTTLHLQRWAHADLFTLGWFILGDMKLVSFELPWRDNRTDLSCIPLGTYPITPLVHPRRGPILLLDGVPDRTEVMVHKGNTSADTKGCILPGLRVEIDMPVAAVRNSGEAMYHLYYFVESAGITALSVELYNPYRAE